MNKILTELSNPVWWFSVVLAGIAINILSSYLRGALDKFFSKSSSWWRNRSEAHKKALEEQIDRIVSNIEDRNLAATDELRMRLGAIFRLLLSIIFLCFAIFFNPYIAQLDFIELWIKLFCFLLFTILLTISLLLWSEATRIEFLLIAAKDRLSKQIIKECADG